MKRKKLRKKRERENFEHAMMELFRAPKLPKHQPKMREKKGKD